MNQRQRIIGLFGTGALIFVGLVLVQGHRLDLPMRITDPADWNALVMSGDCVLFLDCEWNGEVVHYRPVFAEFAATRNPRDKYRVAVVMIDENEEDKVSRLAQGIVDGQGIRYGLKTLFGAGLVLWMKNGALVDHAWSSGLPTVADLHRRTATAFRRQR